MECTEFGFGSMEVLGNLPKVVLVEVESIIYRRSKAVGHWDSLRCHLYLGTEDNRPRHLCNTAIREGHGVLLAFRPICIVIQIHELHVGVILLPDVVDHPRCSVRRHRVSDQGLSKPVSLHRVLRK